MPKSHSVLSCLLWQCLNHYIPSISGTQRCFKPIYLQHVHRGYVSIALLWNFCPVEVSNSHGSINNQRSPLLRNFCQNAWNLTTVHVCFLSSGRFLEAFKLERVLRNICREKRKAIISTQYTSFRNFFSYVGFGFGASSMHGRNTHLHVSDLKWLSRYKVA